MQPRSDDLEEIEAEAREVAAMRRLTRLLAELDEDEPEWENEEE